MGLVVLVLCAALVPALGSEGADGYLPMAIGMYISAVPFFFALHQTWKLLGYVDTNKAFSNLSVTALRKIKQCALIISGLYTAILPFFYIVAQEEDAPGIIVIGMIIVFAAVVVATFAAVLQKLLRSAIDIKVEQDLTV
jgi:hypothetical protein